MPSVWLSTFIRLALVAAAGLIIGWLYDQPVVGLLIAVLCALGFHLLWLYRLERWLHGQRMDFLPDGNGIWSQVFARIEYIRSRAKRRGRRVKDLIRQFRRATKSFPDGGVILDRNNEIVYLNSAAEEMLGLKRKADRGMRIENLIRDPDFVDFVDQEELHLSVELQSPAQHDVWVSCYLVPYGFDQKLLLIRDITRQHKADRMRRDFVANASHELRTPLTVITGYLDALADDSALSPDLARPIQEMHRQAGRMRLLVEELLQLSELEAEPKNVETSQVNVAALLDTARQEAQAMQNCPEKIELIVESQARLNGSEGELQSVVSNLVSNAVRYTPVEGRIALRWWTDDSGGHISVSDSGAGIAREHIPRLSERFYRVENGRERIGGEGGTGLGLAIVKHALMRHDATLEIVSELGKGSVFTCHFPTERVAAGGQ